MEFFTDFCREFEEVSICTLGPDFNHDGVVEAAEAVKVTFGEWLPGTDSYTYIRTGLVKEWDVTLGCMCSHILDSSGRNASSRNLVPNIFVHLCTFDITNIILVIT